MMSQTTTCKTANLLHLTVVLQHSLMSQSVGDELYVVGSLNLTEYIVQQLALLDVRQLGVVALLVVIAVPGDEFSCLAALAEYQIVAVGLHRYLYCIIVGGLVGTRRYGLAFLIHEFVGLALFAILLVVGSCLQHIIEQVGNVLVHLAVIDIAF